MTSTSRAAIAVGLLSIAGLLTATAATATPDRALGLPLPQPAAAATAPPVAAAPTAATPRVADDAGRSAHRKPLAHRHERASKKPARKHAKGGHHGRSGDHDKSRRGKSRHGRSRHHGQVPDSFAARARLVLEVAKAQRGKPYVWGADGPRSFDCSGYVQWVYRHATGRKLPKFTDTQWAVLEHIKRRELRPGDLVFVGAGRHKSHVGIYAGHWRWWVAPHTGSHVKKQRIWPAPHTYARVLQPARK